MAFVVVADRAMRKKGALTFFGPHSFVGDEALAGVPVEREGLPRGKLSGNSGRLVRLGDRGLGPERGKVRGVEVAAADGRPIEADQPAALEDAVDDRFAEVGVVEHLPPDRQLLGRAKGKVVLEVE